jgi:hypothetical protein
MATPPKQLREVLRRHEPHIYDLLVEARTIVLDEIGPCYELIVPIKTLVALIYSSTEKPMKDQICSLIVYRQHVNLMFTRGVDMDDPCGLLEGSGKAIRHVKLRTPNDAGRPGVRPLLAQAKQRDGLGEPAKPLNKVVTMLKAKAADARSTAWPRLF